MARPHHDDASTAAREALMALAGWMPPHHRLEAEAAELADVHERDTLALFASLREPVQ
jgi:hypothetical protein